MGTQASFFKMGRAVDVEPVEITVNKLSVDLQFNDRVIIDWGDGTESKGAGTTTEGVHYTHTYVSVPQTLKVYNWYENNLRLLNTLATSPSCTWDAEISATVFPKGTDLYASSLIISNVNTTYVDADFRNTICRRLDIKRAEKINFEGNTSLIGIVNFDSYNTCKEINVRNTTSLTYIVDASLNTVDQYTYGSGHPLEKFYFDGSNLENYANKWLASRTPSLYPENITGVMYNLTKLHFIPGDLSSAASYFDLSPYAFISDLSLKNNTLDAAQFEEYCLRVKNMVVASGVLNGAFDISGNNAAPSATAQGYIDTMVNTYGWTVTTS